MIEKHQIISLLNDALNQVARLRKNGNELVYFCPKCHHPKRKLEVCIDETNKFFGAFHCWTCSISGNLYDLVSFSNIPPVYKNKLYTLTKGIKWNRKVDSVIANDISLPNEFLQLSIPKNYSPEYKNAMFYLKQRGILPEDIIRYNIGYCEDGDYAFHIIFPSYDYYGNLNFFIGRQYYNVEGMISYKKPKCLMENIIGFESFINYDEPLTLVEGAFDAIAVRNNAIPLFGKFPSKKLRESMIINGTKRVNMVLDNDALDDAIRNCKMMIRLGISVYLVKLNGKDPSVLGFEKIHNLIRDAKEFTDDDLLRYELKL